MKRKEVMAISLLVIAAGLIFMLMGCSTLTIERTYGPDQIASETIRTSGFFMNRAQKIQFVKSQGEAVDNLSTDMTEDASAARDALKDTLALAQVLAQAYMGGFSAGTQGSAVSPSIVIAAPTPTPTPCANCGDK